MARALRVGHPLFWVVAIVAREMPGPIGSEFGIVADEALCGLDIDASLERMTRRLDVPDLRVLSVAVAIQSQSGDNPAEVLAILSRLMRARFKLFRRALAITSEGLWSGWFLSVFPVATLIAMQLIRPGYYDRAMESPCFVPAALAVGATLAVNILFMRMMVNIKV